MSNKKLNIDYNLLRDMHLTGTDLLEWLFIDMIDWIGDFNDRKVRQIHKDGNTIQISVPLTQFDRWSNSVEFEFDTTKKEEYDTFITYIQNERLKEK
jgi:hypothetical protein